MKIQTEDFKNQISKVLKELGFKKKSNSFYCENNEILFVINLDRSNYSNLYYIRGGFFIKPLEKESSQNKYYESNYRWHAKFPVYRNFVFFKKFIKNTDSIDLESINQKALSSNLEDLKQQLDNLLPRLTKEEVRKYDLSTIYNSQ